MNIIIDTGPLVAFFDRSDQYHYHVGKEFARLEPPFHTCEAVITETVFLLLRGNMNPRLLFEMVERGDLVIKPAFNKKSIQQRVRDVVTGYQNLPASFADACLVAMSEQQNGTTIFTLDSDFSIYRNQEGKTLSLLIPDMP